MRSALFLLPVLLLLSSPASAVVTVDWVTVAGAGNACETIGPLGGLPGGCFGAVAEPFRISKFEVINAQYVEFLNAVAASDPNGLFNFGGGGINRSGASGSFTYSIDLGLENRPVFADFWDAVRFANWLQNGQPTGAQDSSTTEDGAYTLTPIGIANNTIVRNAGAEVFVPTEDEWYKSAFYDVGSMTYFGYTTSSNAIPNCVAPSTTPNTANCDFIFGDLADVGSYPASPSPNGTFDQGGNVWEWSETILLFAGSSLRVTRGGDWVSGAFNLGKVRNAEFLSVPTSSAVGIRLASPVPSVPSMHPLGIALFGGLLGLAGHRSLFS